MLFSIFTTNNIGIHFVGYEDSKTDFEFWKTLLFIYLFFFIVLGFLAIINFCSRTKHILSPSIIHVFGSNLTLTFSVGSTIKRRFNPSMLFVQPLQSSGHLSTPRQSCLGMQCNEGRWCWVCRGRTILISPSMLKKEWGHEGIHGNNCEERDSIIIGAGRLYHQEQCRSSCPPGGGRKNFPPGPPGWPLVGNLVQVIFKKKPFMSIVSDLHTKYGPIFTMQMGQRTLVIITSSRLIHEALVQKGAAFASRPPDSPIRQIFSSGKCTINSAPYGPLWRTLRRNMVTELINPKRIQQCSWIREWAMDAHMKRLRNENAENGFVEVMNNCRLTICNILLFICFGEKIAEERIKHIESVLKDVVMMTMPKLPDFLPLLTPLFYRQVKQAKQLREKQMECLAPLVRNRKSFVKSGGKLDGLDMKYFQSKMVSPLGAAYIDSLFTLQVEGRGQLGEEELVTLCSEVINAGTDTSATTVEWALFHLVQNQEIQKKLYNEIVIVVGLDSLVTETDTEKMPYLAAVVKETFRKHPPTHFTLSHAAVSETELGGYTIPADVNVEFYTAWVTGDPSLWTDPNPFRPERFLEGEGMDVDVTGTKGVKMVPFGAGRRICPAMTLGTLHVNLLVARMVHAFEWVAHPSHPPDPTESFAGTVVMNNPLKATILPRTRTDNKMKLL